MGETILLVEDEDSLRRLAKRLLTKLGYNVIEAAGGASALAACGDFPDEIRLVITDVFMPEMAGPELAVRLRDLRPGLKFLFVSGSEEALNREGPQQISAANFLQKPYTQEDLSRKIRQILDT